MNYIILLLVIFFLWGCSNDAGTGGTVINNYYSDNTSSSGIDNTSSSGIDNTSFNTKIGGVFKLPDTGQTDSYTSTFGEDSDYTGNARSFTDNGDGTVTDENTRLMWQQEDDGIDRNWYESYQYCYYLRLGGYTDWRLPKLEELTYLIDFSRKYPPYIDQNYFKNTKHDVYHSISHIPLTYGVSYIVDFGSKSSYYPSKSSQGFVRCNRGVYTENDFEIIDSETLVDHSTNLIWERGNSALLTLDESIAYCENLSKYNRTNWRLPNINEAVSITNAYRGDPINLEFFDITSLWTSTGYDNESFFVLSDYYHSAKKYNRRKFVCVADEYSL